MENQTKNLRLTYLDSVRGIAALMVLFGHFINWKYDTHSTVKIASIFINANDAVSFFFVLSGMVLAYPYLQLDKKLDIGKFYVARAFRIFPAFWVALLLNALYASRHNLDATGLVDLFVKNKLEFWEEALLIRGFNRYYGAGWTLTIEMCFSFLMPFLILIAKQNRKLLPWLLLASFLAINITGLFLFHFVLGLCIAAFFVEIEQNGFKSTWIYKYRVTILLFAIPLFSLRQIGRSSPLGSTLVYAMIDVFKVDYYILSGLAAFVFIIFLIHFKKAQRVFEHPVLIFYGKISYGVYLMHWVLVWASGDYWESKILPHFSSPKIAFFVTMLAVFVLTTIAATLLHYFVELPFMKLGRKVVGKMKDTVKI
jgi:peptidoglycan/LPS O-acetylase OafA/YrhL